MQQCNKIAILTGSCCNDVNFVKLLCQKLWPENQGEKVVRSKYANLHWLAGTMLHVMETSEVTTKCEYESCNV